jgi:hypothetical protein
MLEQLPWRCYTSNFVLDETGSARLVCVCSAAGA